MRQALFLLGAAMAVRFAGAVALRGNRFFFVWAGWLLGGLAGWLVATSAGGWSPFWSGTIPAVACAPFFRRSAPARNGAVDFLAPLSAGFLSVPPLGWTRLAAAGLIGAAAGFALDRLAGAVERRGRFLAPALIAVAASAVVAMEPPMELLSYIAKRPREWVRFSLTPYANAERIVLATGAVARFDPAGPDATGSVIFLHGYHPKGARQPTALALRRAIAHAGFDVLSIDYPGFGESPRPPREAPVSAWDPLPSVVAGYDLLKDRFGDRPIFVVGHSMGTVEAARMLGTDRAVNGVAVLGAGTSVDKPFDGPYWHSRFNKVHRYDPPIDEKKFRAIAQAYHDKARVFGSIPVPHAPLLFVKFQSENSDLKATRDAVYASIPGDKSEVTVDSSHYMNTVPVDFMLVGDPGAARRVAAELRHAFDPALPAIAGAPPERRP